MQILFYVLVAAVALFHLYILWLEMFAWDTKAPGVFTNFPKHLFKDTKALAANQGLYNGFLAAGLTWSFFIDDPYWKMNVSLFFLGCVAVAGIYGAATASKKILFVQGMPAIIGIIIGLIIRYNG
ncbi:DUF1304 domain-containing protein [Chitinophaga horti]|uniref:DUF1304 domain-containing protein n=1 Tax=Chitinophaga horti TaxID=2920382 RepID=A0ABY6J4H8_9BACT|nr:DUF1304 domain-containing protein [Chitinophaga horti]UYQ94578.1 DUF1304 domain-containing protein [Chitinophaga horti]